MPQKQEPNKLTNTLTIVLGELKMVADRLYEMEEEERGNDIEDASAWIDDVRKHCKEKKL